MVTTITWGVLFLLLRSLSGFPRTLPPLVFLSSRSVITGPGLSSSQNGSGVADRKGIEISHRGGNGALLSCLSEGTGSPERGLDARRTRDWNEAGDTMFDLYLLLIFSSCTINVSRRGYLGACHLILRLSWAFPSHTGLGVRVLATKRTRHRRERWSTS